MDTRRIVVGTLVGGVASYVVGYLIFDMAFGGFYAANVGSATGVARDPQLIWAMLLGNIAYASLIIFALGNRTGSVTIGAAAKVGAVVGFLLWFTVDFLIYGGSNISNLTRTIVDPLLEIVRAGIVGGVIAGVMQMIPASGVHDSHPA